VIIGNEGDVTPAVLSELERAGDPRFREIMGAAVRHLHAFVREARLTEAEFQQACATIARLGQLTTASHNEVVLVAGSLGISQLVCLLNNGKGGTQATSANLLGPFWREGSPPTPNGGSIVRSPTPGAAVLVTAWIENAEGRPVAGAEVDVWQASADGYYENQDPAQAEMNLRGKFTSDAQGKVSFHTVKPAGYPVPVAGPVGELLRAQGRHNLRPAHIHFLIHKPGYKTQFSQIYSSDDPNLETDSQFGVTRSLIGHYVRDGEGYTLEHRFVIEPGEAKLPRAPISAKAIERPSLQVLQRRE